VNSEGTYHLLEHEDNSMNSSTTKHTSQDSKSASTIPEPSFVFEKIDLVSESGLVPYFPFFEHLRHANECHASRKCIKRRKDNTQAKVATCSLSLFVFLLICRRSGKPKSSSAREENMKKQEREIRKAEKSRISLKRSMRGLIS
jgi:hypothetical protein